jgi:hypothetical protein
MFTNYKVGANAEIPIRLLDSTGAAVAGVAYGSVTATLHKPGAGASTVTVSPASGSYWAEVTAGAFSGKGFYVLTIPAASIDTAGPNVVSVNGSTGTCVVEFTVVTNLESDNYARLGAPIGASISADLNILKGLLFGNAVQDQQAWTSGRLTSARIRIYDTAANANSAGATGLLATYTVTATYDGNGNLTLFKITG